MAKWYRNGIAIILGIGLATLFAAGVVTIRRAREDLLRSQCNAHMFQTAFQIASYYRANNRLPPARFHGDAKKDIPYSWRAFAFNLSSTDGHRDLPLRYNFDEPWDSRHNASFMRRPISQLLACPGDSNALAGHMVSYVAVVGKDTLWLPNEFRNLEEYDRKRLEEKILLVELPDSDIRWTEPRDISLEEALKLFAAPDGLRNCRRHHGLFYITLAGKYARIDTIPSVEVFREMLTVGPQDRKQ